MSDPREIGSVRGASFQPPQGRPDQARPVRDQRPDGGGQRREPQDRVELHSPDRLALDVMQERILARTREELAVDAAEVGRLPFVRDGSVSSFAAFVSRLVSEQNMIAAVRRAEWGPGRLERAVQRGTERGMREAIEELDDLGRLDERAWMLISGVLAELQRKLTLDVPLTRR